MHSACDACDACGSISAEITGSSRLSTSFVCQWWRTCQIVRAFGRNCVILSFRPMRALQCFTRVCNHPSMLPCHCWYCCNMLQYVAICCNAIPWWCFRACIELIKHLGKPLSGCSSWLFPHEEHGNYGGASSAWHHHALPLLLRKM